MPVSGPWVNIAAFCTHAGNDDEQGGAQLRGLMDNVTIDVRGAAPPPGTPLDFDVDLLLVLQLVAGDFKGKLQIVVDIEGPSGRHDHSNSTESFFAAPRQRVWNNMQFKAHFWGPGHYWFNVVGNGRLLTRIPFEVTLNFVD